MTCWWARAGLTLPSSLFRLYDRPAAFRCAAVASIEGEILSGVLVQIFVLVIVRQLRTLRNALDRFDPDMSALDERIAIRITGVIDEACVVSIERGVDDPFAVQREQKGVMTLVPLIRISAIGLGIADLLADVLDDAS